MSNESYKVILTNLEVEKLETLVEMTEAKLGYQQKVLEVFRSAQKSPVGEDQMTPDAEYVRDVYDTAKQLDYYKVLLSNYELANPQTDAVEIGSYVSVYDSGSKQALNFMIVQENRLPNGALDVKLVSKDAPMASAIMGKKVGESFTFTKPSGSLSNGIVTDIDNEFCKTTAKQKQLG